MAKRKRRPPAKVYVPLVLWDTAWKLLAIRRAWQLDQRRMIPGLAFANTMGIWPIMYLWRNRGAELPVKDETEPASPIPNP